MNYQGSSLQSQAPDAVYVSISGASEPPRIPRFTGATNQLEEMLKGLTEFTTRLHQTADRLGGCVPEPAEKTGTMVQGARSDSAGRLEQVAESYAAVMRRLRHAVERFETL